jgi:hypothetical protein
VLHVRGSPCNCGFRYTDAQSTYRHILSCDQSCAVTHTVRHNRARDAIAMVTREYGITVSSEPTFYSYDDGREVQRLVQADTCGDCSLQWPLTSREKCPPSKPPSRRCTPILHCICRAQVSFGLPVPIARLASTLLN